MKHVNWGGGVLIIVFSLLLEKSRRLAAIEMNERWTGAGRMEI